MLLSVEARGEAYAILEVAKATAMGIKEIAGSLIQDGDQDAMSLKIASSWIESFGKLAKDTNSMIVPTNVSDLASVTAILKNTFDFAKKKGPIEKEAVEE